MSRNAISQKTARKRRAAAKQAKALAQRLQNPESVELSRLYGASYFGSGGGYGRVKLKNAETITWRDNGFICGPREIRVVDPTQPASIRAGGGDLIGEGRRWSEAYDYTPEAGWQKVEA